jgi:hypothetical protein
MGVLFEGPLLVDLYLADDLLDEGYLVDLHPEITVFVAIPCLLLTLHLRTTPLAVVLVTLQDVEDKGLPEIILAGAVDDGGGAIEL